MANFGPVSIFAVLYPEEQYCLTAVACHKAQKCLRHFADRLRYCRSLYNKQPLIESTKVGNLHTPAVSVRLHTTARVAFSTTFTSYSE
jgi:hypothetical protein